MFGNGTIASNVGCTWDTSNRKQSLRIYCNGSVFFVVVRKKRILSSAERGLVLVENLWQTELKTWEELVATAPLIPSRESLIC